MPKLDPDMRKWFYYPIVMPINKEGHGPASEESGDIWKIKWEVWDQETITHGSYDYLFEAVNEAMRLELERLAKLPPRSKPDDTALQDGGTRKEG